MLSQSTAAELSTTPLRRRATEVPVAESASAAFSHASHTSARKPSPRVDVSSSCSSPREPYHPTAEAFARNPRPLADARATSARRDVADTLDSKISSFAFRAPTPITNAGTREIDDRVETTDATKVVLVEEMA